VTVRVLEITTYPPNARRYETRAVDEPTWADVEASIRNLDHHERPFVFLGLEDNDHESDCLSVLGGPRGYTITGTLGSERWYQFADPTHGDDEVAVWTSDQGFYPPARNVCYDLDLVMKIAKYFCEQGQLAPFVQWE